MKNDKRWSTTTIRKQSNQHSTTLWNRNRILSSQFVKRQEQSSGAYVLCLWLPRSSYHLIFSVLPNYKLSSIATISLLFRVYEAVARISWAETGLVTVGSLTYNEWSPKHNGPISGMNFHSFDRNWYLRTFPIFLFDTVDVGKWAKKHQQIISVAIVRSDRLDKDCLIFSVTFDNESFLALRVDKYLNFSGPVRCICHTIAFDQGCMW